MDSLLHIASTYKALFLTIHILGTVLALGGATLADMFFFRFLKDFRISEKEADVMQWISKVIMAGLLVIYLSGFMLYLSDPVTYNSSGPFLFKMLIVIVVSVNGILLHEFISPKLVHISFIHVRPHVHEHVHHLRKVAFAMGAVSVTSWYTVFFTAMLKSLLPEDIRLGQMLLVYLAVLMTAVFCSQVAEKYLLHRSRLFE